AAEKALSPQVRRLVLMVLRVFAPADLRQRVGGVEGEEGRGRGQQCRGLVLRAYVGTVIVLCKGGRGDGEGTKRMRCVCVCVCVYSLFLSLHLSLLLSLH